MNEKFRTIGLDTEDKITEFIDYIDDLEDTEEIKSDVYGFFEVLYFLTGKINHLSHKLLDVF